MFFLKAIYCRIFQGAFRMALPVLPYRDPTIIPDCEELGNVLKKEQVKNVLIVTDKGIASNGLIFPVEEVLKSRGISFTVYDETQPNPSISNVEEALCIYRKHNCDTLIAIGGGSSMDCAKALGARVAYPKRSLQRLKGKLRVWRRLPTLIAIPTTAGTGSETTLAAIISDPEKHQKYALMSFPLIPHYAVLDASFTYSLPPHLTASTGMDALVHAVEAYIGRSTTKQTRALALDATTLIFQNIEAAYADGRNHEARTNMLHAAYKAGAAFSKSYVGYVHAVAHSLGGQYGTPHGLANAVLLPYVLEAYGPCIHKKLHRLAIAAGVATENDTHEAAAKAFIKAVKTLNANMQIPCKLHGIREEDIPIMAKHAEKEANPLYPVPKLMTKAQLERFYEQVRATE